jgi:hypothetical protein
MLHGTMSSVRYIWTSYHKPLGCPQMASSFIFLTDTRLALTLSWRFLRGISSVLVSHTFWQNLIYKVTCCVRPFVRASDDNSAAILWQNRPAEPVLCFGAAGRGGGETRGNRTKTSVSAQQLPSSMLPQIHSHCSSSRS